MARYDRLANTIEAIRRTGEDPDGWPVALRATAALIGGHAASIEVLDSRSCRPIRMTAYGLESQPAYLAEFAAISPRLPHMARRRPGWIGWDYQLIDERGIDRDPFYADFLARHDIRYYVGAVLIQTADTHHLFGVQRSRRQGHPDASDIALMERLLPHLQQSVEMSHRLETALAAQRSIEEAMDWLTDGIFLLRADGTIMRCNLAAQAIAAQADGVSIKNKRVDFTSPAARDRYAAALADAERLHGDPLGAPPGDFPAPRVSEAASYLVSVRTLTDASRRGAAFAVMIRDPLRRDEAIRPLLSDLFGFTQAEAHVAEALRAGVTAHGYARLHRLSINTVYTHLKRLRAKTGTRRLPELLRKLNDIQLAARK